MSIPVKTPITTVDIPELRKFSSGKVREIFELDDALLIVTTDRISAFDCVLSVGIPYKGIVLNQLSLFWFEKFSTLFAGHVISSEIERFDPSLKKYEPVLKGRAMIVKKAKVLPVECIVRGYLAGSGWKEYQKAGTVCGIELLNGLKESSMLDEPIFTPSTKAEEGHDENITFEQMSQIVGEELARKVRQMAISLYKEAASYARERGIIIADTKFEFGLIDEELTLIDEVLTPDSSRFWPADSYVEGTSQPSFDKQYVRDYLSGLPWNKQPPAPALPDYIVERTSEKYIEAYRILTGKEFDWKKSE